MTEILLLLLPAFVAFALVDAAHLPGRARSSTARAGRGQRTLRRAARRAVVARPSRASPRAASGPRGGALLAHRVAGRAPPHGSPEPPDPYDPFTTRSTITMTRRTIKLTAAAAAATLALPAAAQAHVTAYAAGDVPPEGYGKVDFRVPHGCDGSPTTSITVQLPDTVVGATPQVVSGWRIKTKEGKLANPIEAHGEKITEGIREVSWTGGPLPEGRLQEFGMSIQTAGGKAGETAYFKVLQECEKGETAWAEIPVEGEEEPESPAAAIVFAEAEGHGANGDAAETAAPAEQQSAGVSASDVDGKASRAWRSPR